MVVVCACVPSRSVSKQLKMHPLYSEWLVASDQRYFCVRYSVKAGDSEVPALALSLLLAALSKRPLFACILQIW